MLLPQGTYNLLWKIVLPSLLTIFIAPTNPGIHPPLNHITDHNGPVGTSVTWYFKLAHCHMLPQPSLLSRAWEPANFLTAPAPDFFFKRLRLRLQLRLLIFFPSGSGSWYFFWVAPAQALAPRNQKKTAPAPDYWLSLTKYSFPRKLVR